MQVNECVEYLNDIKKKINRTSRIKISRDDATRLK